MHDEKTTVSELKMLMKKIVDERDWNQFHTPKNLSEKIMIEAAELLEIFNWCEGKDSFAILQKKRADVEQELADVIITALAFANACSIDMAKAVTEKMAIIAQRYPVEECKGKSDKYTAYYECKDRVKSAT